MTIWPRLGVLALVVWGLSLPLADVLRYPDRVSVLPNLQTDAEAYHALAVDLAESQSLAALPPRHPPVWVGILAITYAVNGGPSFVAGKLVLLASLVVVVWTAWWLGRRIYGPVAGGVGAVLCATSPAMRAYVGTLQYEVFTAALLGAVVVLAVRTMDAAPREVVRRAALVGVSGGLLVLTRESFAVVMPVLAAWVGSRIRPVAGRRTAVQAGLLIVALSAAPGVIWSVAQSIRTGALITISEKGPIVIELGNNPRANGTYNAPLVGIGQPTGLAFIAQHPGQWAVLAVRKVLYFWGVLRDGWNAPRPVAVWVWRATTGLVPLEWITPVARGGWLLAAFIVAILLAGREGLRAWWGLPAAALALMCVHIVTLSSHRFAVPVLPLVFVLISGPVAGALRRAAGALRSPAVAVSAALLAAVVTAMQYQSWPLQIDLHAGDLEGLEADTIVGPDGQRVRAADARRGLRPVVLFTDEYLPRGPIALSTELRFAGTPSQAAGPAVRIALVDLDGRPACSRDLASTDQREAAGLRVTLVCHLPQDGPTTLAIYSLGTEDFVVGAIQLRWWGRP